MSKLRTSALYQSRVVEKAATPSIIMPHQYLNCQLANYDWPLTIIYDCIDSQWLGQRVGYLSKQS